MITHKEKMASLSPERRARIEARAEKALKEIRAGREQPSQNEFIEEKKLG